MEYAAWYIDLTTTIRRSKQLKIRDCYSIAVRENAANLTLQDIANAFKLKFYQLLFQSLKTIPLKVVVLDDVDAVILNGLASVLKPEVSPNLLEFHMSELVSVGQSKLQSILEQLSAFPNLQVVTFPAKLKGDCCECLSTFLKTCSSKLDYVEISGKLGGSTKREMDLDFVAKGLSRMKLLHLKLPNICIGTDNGLALSRFLATQRWLRFLDLSNVKMGTTALLHALAPLIEYKVIEELYLYENCLTDDCLPLLSQLISQNTLKALDISLNSFYGQNFDILSKSIGSNSSLEAFFIGNKDVVRLKPGSVQNLGRFLKPNKSLVKIGIFGFPKVTDIIKELRYTTTLNVCNFGSLQELDEKDQILLYETLISNQSLKDVIFKNESDDVCSAVESNMRKKDSFGFFEVARLLSLFPIIYDIKLHLLQLLTDFVPEDLHVIGLVLLDLKTIFPTWSFLQDKSHFIRICHKIHYERFRNVDNQ